MCQFQVNIRNVSSLIRQSMKEEKVIKRESQIIEFNTTKNRTKTSPILGEKKDTNDS